MDLAGKKRGTYLVGFNFYSPIFAPKVYRFGAADNLKLVSLEHKDQ